MSDFYGDMLGAVKACVTTNLPAAKAVPLDVVSSDAPAEYAFKAEGVTPEGLIIAKASRAGNFDREKERVLLPALKAATYELVQNIGLGRIEVDINHGVEAIKCDVVQAWIGYPMPDENATYVALRPHDPAVVEAVKAHGAGMSWSGPYRLVASR